MTGIREHLSYHLPFHFMKWAVLSMVLVIANAVPMIPTLP